MDQRAEDLKDLNLHKSLTIHFIRFDDLFIVKVSFWKWYKHVSHLKNNSIIRNFDSIG